MRAVRSVFNLAKKECGGSVECLRGLKPPAINPAPLCLLRSRGYHKDINSFAPTSASAQPQGDDEVEEKPSHLYK